jgi:cytidylate kinase
MMIDVVTIDGPVASGKSSVAKALAQHLQFKHLNTGLLYRAAAYLAADQEPGDFAWLADVRYDFADGQPVIFWRGQRLANSFLYSPVMDQAASLLSADAALRALLLPIQREVAQRYHLIADGRDCGSVVFPDATVKIFLTATPRVRAERLKCSTERDYAGMSIEAITAEVRARDARDQERAVAPLVVPKGATIIDSSDLSFAQTVAKCLALVQEHQM